MVLNKNWNACVKEAFKQVEAYSKDSDKKTLLIVIDGMSAAGKTTLGVQLQAAFGGNLFHTDDFFLQPHQRTAKRLAETGGNLDYERFKAEIIDKLEEEQGLCYGVYDCYRQCIARQVSVPYESVNIIEGSYSAHPYFGDKADLYFFMEIDAEEQKRRIKARNGESMLERFVQEWIPRENQYFEAFHIREKCICLRTDMKEQEVIRA